MYLSKKAQSFINDLRKKDEFLYASKSNIADAMAGILMLSDYWESEDKDFISGVLHELVSYNTLLIELSKDEEE
jgi:hypothetical protein